MTTLQTSLNRYDELIGLYSHQLRRRWLIIGFAILLATITLGIVSKNIGIALLMALFFGLLCYIPAIRLSVRPLWATGKAMRAFADSQNLRYIDTAKPNYKKHFQPAVAKIGLFERQEQIIVGEYNGLAFRSYVNTYRHPFAYRWSRVATRVYELDLPKEFPHIFLRNRNSDNRFFSTVLRHFDDSQRISLEGDFDAYFTTYTHIATTTQALSLLAPNVMQTLIRTNKKFDIEIAGNKLYLYTSDYYVTGDDLKDMFDTLDSFMNHVERRLKSWKFTLPNNKHYPYMASRAGAGTIAIGQKYYSQAWVGITAYTIYNVVKLCFDRSYLPAKLSALLFFDIVMIVILLIFRRKYQLSNRNVGR